MGKPYTVHTRQSQTQMVLLNTKMSMCSFKVSDTCALRYAAKYERTLKAIVITHVGNAADGKFNMNIGPSFYRDTKITYLRIEAFVLTCRPLI